MKTLRQIGQLLAMIFIIGGTFWFAWHCSRIAHAYPEPFTPKIHSIGETQQELRDAGYPIKVDYKWGPETERAYCDYMANYVQEANHD